MYDEEGAVVAYEDEEEDLLESYFFDDVDAGLELDDDPYFGDPSEEDLEDIGELLEADSEDVKEVGFENIGIAETAWATDLDDEEVEEEGEWSRDRPWSQGLAGVALQGRLLRKESGEDRLDPRVVRSLFLEFIQAWISLYADLDTFRCLDADEQQELIESFCEELDETIGVDYEVEEGEVTRMVRGFLEED